MKKTVNITLSFLVSILMIFSFTVIFSNIYVQAKDITVFSQTDSRWGSHYYGYSNTAGTQRATISSGGCGILAYTNAVYYLNNNFIEPVTLADWSVANGYRVNGVGTSLGLYKAFADSCGGQYGIKYSGQTSSYSSLKDHLNSGGVAIGSAPNHLMAVVDYDNSNGKYLILDSYKSSNRYTYSTGYTWQTEFTIRNTAKLNFSTFILLSSTNPNPCNCSDSYAGEYEVTTSSLPLTIRSGHGSGYSSLGTMLKGTHVYVSKADGSWAHVEYNGISGYSSMEYLTKVSNPPSYNSIYTSKSEYEFTDTVSIFVDSPNGTSLAVGIDKEGVGRVVTENCGSTYNISASMLGQGKYSAYMTIYNDSGWIDTTRVEFTIKGSVPSSPTLGAYIGTNFAPTTFGWNATENTDYYSLKIWNGTYWQGEPYKVEWEIRDTNCSLNLPAGYYEAYVDAVNSNGCTMSNVIQFTVEYGSTFDKGNDFYANIIRNDGWQHLSDVDGNVAVKNDGNKLWHFTKTSDGGYFIQNVATGKYLDLDHSRDENGCNVKTWNYNGSNAQIWYLYGRWGEYLKPKCTSDRVLDIDRASGNAQIWDLLYSDNQKFAIWIYDTFNVTYNMNGGIGNVENQIKVDTYDLTIRSEKPNRTGYNFVGWSTDQNATTAEYVSGATFSKNEDTTLYAVWKAIPLENMSKISTTQVKLDETIKITASATGGEGSYTYAVLYKKTSDTKWIVKQNYSTNANVTIRPAAATGYEICVKVKDSNGTIEKKYFTVNVQLKLANNSVLSATEITLGNTVTAKAQATGGTGGYTYAVLYKKTSDTKWTVKQNYKANDTITIKPAHSTEYDVCIKVKDSSGTVEKKYFTVNVKKPALANNAAVSKSSVTLGNSVTVKATATGGTSPYTYAVYTKKSTASKWTENQAYSANASVNFKPTEKGTYDICVKVKDKSGTIEKKYLTITVK